MRSGYSLQHLSRQLRRGISDTPRKSASLQALADGRAVFELITAGTCYEKLMPGPNPRPELHGVKHLAMALAIAQDKEETTPERHPE